MTLNILEVKHNLCVEKLKLQPSKTHFNTTVTAENRKDKNSIVEGGYNKMTLIFVWAGVVFQLFMLKEKENRRPISKMSDVAFHENFDDWAPAFLNEFFNEFAGGFEHLDIPAGISQDDDGFSFNEQQRKQEWNIFDQSDEILKISGSLHDALGSFTQVDVLGGGSTTLDSDSEEGTKVKDEQLKMADHLVSKSVALSRRYKKRKMMYEDGTNLNNFVKTVPVMIHRAMETGNVEELVLIFANSFEEMCSFHRMGPCAMPGPLIGRHHAIDFHVGLMRTHPDHVAIFKGVDYINDEMISKVIINFRMMDKDLDGEVACIVNHHADAVLKMKSEQLSQEKKNFSMVVKVEQRFKISSQSGLIEQYSCEIVKVVDIYEPSPPPAFSMGVESIPIHLLNAMNSSNMSELERILYTYYEAGCTLTGPFGTQFTGRAHIMQHFHGLDDTAPDMVRTVQHITVADNVVICDTLISFTMVGKASQILFPGTTVHMKNKMQAIVASGKLARQTCAGLMLLHVNPATGLIHDMSVTIRPIAFSKAF